MHETIAKTIVYALAIYAGLAFVFAVPFLWLGVQCLDFESSGIRHWLSTPDSAWRRRVLAHVLSLLEARDGRASGRKEPPPVVEQAVVRQMMIQPLGAVHRRAFIALALVLPAILLIGLGAVLIGRGNVPVSTGLSIPLRAGDLGVALERESP